MKIPSFLSQHKKPHVQITISNQACSTTGTIIFMVQWCCCRSSTNLFSALGDVAEKCRVFLVKDTQNLETLVFCFTSLMTVEAAVLFGVYTNLPLFYICFYFCCKIVYPNLYFPNYVLSYFSFHFSFFPYD